MLPSFLDTFVTLPPGLPSGELVGKLLGIIFREYRWFEPRRYGSASLSNAIDPMCRDFAPLLAYYEERKNLCVAARTDKDFIWFLPARSDEHPHIGRISWTTSASSASKASWRTAHARQVVELMRLVQSPLAIIGMEEEFERKTRRWVREGTAETRVITVRDYSQGLAGLFWRNFYGPPFVRMFGQRLDALLTESRVAFGEDIVLVQPYDLPTAAGTEAGIAREREIISLLGPECFYDHEHHRLPTRRPEVEP